MPLKENGAIVRGIQEKREVRVTVQTWLSSSEGLILAKRLKSMIVICRAISSGSKSNTLRTADGVSGN